MRKRARPPALEARVTTLKLFEESGDARQNEVTAVLPCRDGSFIFATYSAVYLYIDGRAALFVGNPSKAGFKDGTGDKVRFDYIADLDLVRDGDLLVCDCHNHSIRLVSKLGQVVTLAGNGKSGYLNGTGLSARFYWPSSIAVDVQGLIYVSDRGNHCIRTVRLCEKDAEVLTLCGGSGEFGCKNGSFSEARFNEPQGLAVDMNCDLIVADRGNHVIRKVSISTKQVTIVAGPASGADGPVGVGFADGASTVARFSFPFSVAVDGTNSIIVTDLRNRRIRKICGTSGTVTTLAGSGSEGNEDGVGLSASFNKPRSLCVDWKGNVLVSDLTLASIRILEIFLPPPRHLCDGESAAEMTALSNFETGFGSLLEQGQFTDVSFLVEGQRFDAHSQVLLAQSKHFQAMLTSGQGMREGGLSGTDGCIELKGVSPGAFRVLLRHLYTQELPETIDAGEGLVGGEMVKTADYFQAETLFNHCLVQYKDSLRVENVIKQLVYAHGHRLAFLEEACVQFLQANVEEFRRRALRTLSVVYESANPELVDMVMGAIQDNC